MRKLQDLEQDGGHCVTCSGVAAHQDEIQEAQGH